MTANIEFSPGSFDSLGEFAAAGEAATRLALERAGRSASQRRIPIAGALVVQGDAGEVEAIAVGHNGRIPPPGTDEIGYPTDHGETAAVRAIADFASVDWARAVFATTLSPCIMCTRTLEHLYGLGLRRLVVAESRSFQGQTDRLADLPGMQIVELENPQAVALMSAFARTYPWDWAADIGEVPPAPAGPGASAEDPDADERILDELEAWRHANGGPNPVAGVFTRTGRLVIAAMDERAATGGNPVMSAPMLAMGRAGSAVNLRDCIIAYVDPRAGPGSTPMSVDQFGASSLGACELFRPLGVLTRPRLE